MAYTKVTILEHLRVGTRIGTRDPLQRGGACQIPNPESRIPEASNRTWYRASVFRIKFYANENVGSGELESARAADAHLLVIGSRFRPSWPRLRLPATNRRDGVVDSGVCREEHRAAVCNRHDIGQSVDGGTLEQSSESNATGAGSAACPTPHHGPERLHLRQLPWRHRFQPAALTACAQFGAARAHA